MELNELAEQYLQLSHLLLERIHRLKGCVNRLSGNDKLIMKRRIMSLYIDAAECRRCALHLKSCKKGVTNNEQNNLQS